MDAIQIVFMIYTCLGVISSRFVKYLEPPGDEKDSHESLTYFQNLNNKDISVENNTAGIELKVKLETDKLRAKRSDVMNITQSACSFNVSSASIDRFREQVIQMKSTSLHLRLKFPQAQNLTGLPEVILPFTWKWYFQDTLPYLQMPYPAVVWSLGLLSLHGGRIIDVELSAVEGCHDLNWVIGTNSTDKMIGNALGELIDAVKGRDMRYNTSHWCYRKAIKKPFSVFDHNFFTASPRFEYICCKYRLNLGMVCGIKFACDPVWWDVPLGLGILMLQYFTLLLLKIWGAIHEKILQTSERTDDIITGNIQGMIDTTKERNKTGGVYLNGKSPITPVSMVLPVFSQLMSKKQATNSRIVIILHSLATLLLPGVELIAYSIFLYDYSVDLARNDISIGFSALLVGWDARSSKFSFFGGPFVALGIYLIIGWVVLVIPKSLANTIYYGVFEGHENSKCILMISLEQKERLGSVKIGKYTNGYYRLLKLQISHIYMLINFEFWILAVQIIKSRFRYILTILDKCLPSKYLAYFIAVLIFPFHVAFSLLEIAVAMVFYAVPIFSFIICCSRGLTVGLNKYVEEKCCSSCGRTGAILRYPFGLFVFLLMIYYSYVLTVLFLDGFVFLSRILMFTYTAVVAYPQETYGYFMLALISSYFGLEGFIHFGDIYHFILKITVKLCKQDAALQGYLCHYKDSDDTEVCGISKNVFEYLVEQIRPRRVQVFHSIVKFASMIFVLTVSIILIERFQKFDELSLLIHVFIIVFVCALPGFCTFAISKESTKAQLRKKIKKHLQSWVNENTPRRNGSIESPTVLHP